MVTNTFARPFTEQADFFRQKINLPSERWDDIRKSAHDRAFIVAGVNKADLLNDLRKAIDQCIVEGKSLGWYQKNFDEIVKKHGWTGWTGEGSKAGRDWRTTITYQTNMSTSYAAGRWKQLHDPDLVKFRPYLTYHHGDARRPRPLHLSWNGFTAPRDHPFWQTHACPNGWRCHCYITASSEQDYVSAKAAGKHQPPDGWDKIDPKTGEMVGIDQGFGYAPGANINAPLRQFVQDKLITYPPAISKALSHEVNRYINATQSASSYASTVLKDKSRTEPLWVGFSESSANILREIGVDTQGYMVTIPAEAPRHIAREHGHDGGTQRPPVSDDYQQVWVVLAEFDSVRLSDKLSRHGLQMIEATKRIGTDEFTCVFEVRSGSKNRSLGLYTMYIKVR